jgi:molybdopterin/thiamine biosynthesis adenylyltransferase
MTQSEPTGGARAERATPSRWSYEEAFSRNVGLIDREEQQRLRSSRVSIVGMGGVGGVHLITLARLGVSQFTIADPDTFGAVNFNRQYGATTRSLGRNKAEVMAEEARAINPEVEVTVLPGGIGPENVGQFLDGADVLVDGIDFFELPVRRLLFRQARERGLWAVTAGPLGFSTAWLTFSPTGMSFDDYFDLHDNMSRSDQLIAFLVGLAPQATQRVYMDLREADPYRRRGPSAGLACQLCSGVVAAEVAKILLGRPHLRPAPAYSQFDAYRHLFRKGRLRWGNRGLVQRLKRWLARKEFARHGWDKMLDGTAPVVPTAGARDDSPTVASS